MESDSTNPQVNSNGQASNYNFVTEYLHMKRGEAGSQNQYPEAHSQMESKSTNPTVKSDVQPTSYSFGSPLLIKAHSQMESKSTNPTVKSDVQPTSYSFGSPLPIKVPSQMESDSTNPTLKSDGQSTSYSFGSQFPLMAPSQMESKGTNPTVKSDVQPTSYSFGSLFPIKNPTQMESNTTNLTVKSDSQPNSYSFGSHFPLMAPTQMESNTTNPTVKSDVQPTNYSFGSQLPIKASFQMGSNYTNLPMKSYGQPTSYNFADQFRLMKRGEAEAHNQNQNPDVRAISESNIQFTFDLFKVLGEEPGNLFFSPLSIHVILSLLYLGAVGNTAEELRHGLRLPDDDRVVKDGVNATMEQLKAARDVILDVANKIYLMIGSAILDSFNAAAVKFMASVDQVDFGAGEAVRKIINTWVEEKTHERIKDLIPVGALNSATTLVLVNAVYFKGDWIKKFDKKDTKKMSFYSTSTEEVEMMYVRSTFKYAYRHELNSQVLLLPYKGNRLNMIIFLPSQVNGLLELETKLSGANFHDLMTRMYGNDVYVYLPKFKMEYSKNLNDAVQKLGMKSMFGDRTMGLTGITGDPMKVSQIMHKSFIEVNEEGTEAAAATAVICCQLTSTSSKPPPIVFKADHPFLFFIVDSQTTAILFAGRFATVC